MSLLSLTIPAFRVVSVFDVSQTDGTHGTLVRYADDTVIICKNKKGAKHALNLLRYIMGKLDLKLHPVKTRIVSMWDGKKGEQTSEMDIYAEATDAKKKPLSIYLD